MRTNSKTNTANRSWKFNLIVALFLAGALLLASLPQAAQAAATEETWEFNALTGASASLVSAPALQQEPVYALPGTLREARNQPFATYLVANDGTIYGLVGETSEVERQITAYRNLGPDVEVKVWGTLFPNGRLSTSPEIVVTDIKSDTALSGSGQGQEDAYPETAATVAIVQVPAANVRSGPSTAYPVIGSLVQNQTCTIIGRNAESTWWEVSCANGLIGWISNDIVRVVGSTANIPVIPVAPPPVPPTPVPAPPTPTAPSGYYEDTSGRRKGDWEASYFNNPDLAGNPTVVRVEARNQYPLDRDWGTNSPVPGYIGNTNWSARWKAIYTLDPGNYTFKARTDDGVRVYLDGHLLIDAWYDGFKEVQNTFWGVGAGDHEIVIEFYQRGGTAFARVYWFKESGSGGSGSGSGGGSRDE